MHPFKHHGGVDGWGGEARGVDEMEEAGGRGCTKEVAAAAAAAPKDSY